MLILDRKLDIDLAQLVEIKSRAHGAFGKFRESLDRNCLEEVLFGREMNIRRARTHSRTFGKFPQAQVFGRIFSQEFQSVLDERVGKITMSIRVFHEICKQCIQRQ